MRLAIADPPYLGRGVRWYGGGVGRGRGEGVADNHPDAAIWDRPEAHLELVARLTADFDGWAIAASSDSLAVYLSACPPDAQVLVWHRRNAPPSGARMRNAWEPVILRMPANRRGRSGSFDSLDDVLDIGSQRIGFTGSKPPAWTRWVLAALGYDPAEDHLTDVFAGSGSVTLAANGMLI